MGNKRKIREEARKLNPMDDLLFPEDVRGQSILRGNLTGDPFRS